MGVGRTNAARRVRAKKQSFSRTAPPGGLARRPGRHAELASWHAKRNEVSQAAATYQMKTWRSREHGAFDTGPMKGSSCRAATTRPRISGRSGEGALMDRSLSRVRCAAERGTTRRSATSSTSPFDASALIPRLQLPCSRLSAGVVSTCS